MMRKLLPTVCVLAVVFLTATSTALAQQQRPAGGTQRTPRTETGTRAEVVARLRAMMESSGMTPEEIRARLRSRGYSESLLDPYMAGARGADSAAIPTEDVFDAVRALSVADSLELDTLSRFSRGERRRQSRSDSAFVDSVVAALRADTTNTTRDALRRLLRTRLSERSVADSGFDRFGSALFDRETTEFDPNLTAMVGPDYALGPGDRLVLVLTGDTEKAYQLEVTRQGFIVIPDVGQIPVANLTLGQLEDQLYTALGRVYSGLRRGPGATTHFSINVARAGSNQIHVTGDVKRPGAYQVSRAGSVLTALYLAGGPSEAGSMRNVQIRRAGALVGTIDLYDYALNGSVANVAFRSGDVLFVPPRGGEVRIAGAVLRPATYEVRSGETVADVIRMAGGFRPEADRRFVLVDRIVPHSQRMSIGASRRMIQVATQSTEPNFAGTEVVHPGDVVHVLSIPTRLASRITVLGNVWQPGPLAFVPGMRLSTALRSAGGLKPDSYLREVVINRLLPDSSREVITAALRDTTGEAINDVELMDADEIRVFSLTDLRSPTYVTISGAVREPGRFPYRTGMTLRQLVLLAGGLQDNASLAEAEIARIAQDRSGSVLAETRRVPLDSSYVFSRAGARANTAVASSAISQDVLLQPYDAVLILQQSNWQMQQIVTVRGEVRHPGQYALRHRGERLAEIIERAGGITPDGYAGGIFFYRKRDRVGRIGLNLPAVLKNRRHSDNILLVDGDSIVIPKFESVVRVEGEVNAPVAVAYIAGQNMDYYINAAGGGTANADVKRAYVTQANGKVQSRSSYLGLVAWVPKPQPGSTIVVPERPDDRSFNWQSLIGTTASLLTAVVTMIAVTR